MHSILIKSIFFFAVIMPSFAVADTEKTYQYVVSQLPIPATLVVENQLALLAAGDKGWLYRATLDQGTDDSTLKNMGITTPDLAVAEQASGVVWAPALVPGTLEATTILNLHDIDRRLKDIAETSFEAYSPDKTVGCHIVQATLQTNQAIFSVVTYSGEENAAKIAAQSVCFEIHSLSQEASTSCKTVTLASASFSCSPRLEAYIDSLPTGRTDQDL